MLRALGIDPTPRDMRAVHARIGVADADAGGGGSTVIDFPAFAAANAWFIDHGGEEDLEGAFRAMDPSDSGRVTAAEARRLLAAWGEVPSSELGALLAEHSDGAGNVAYMPLLLLSA
jgi:Ca2+-binding EF-hand superfamily protein